MQLSNKSVHTHGTVTAVLGPTNTGKTHYAMERMVGYASGVIGFPLRLLARENYERLVALKGADAVALVTGEEKIIPPHARYYACTVESMPVEQVFEFLAVDEIQLCADPDRGHVFTDRLLRARGTKQTMFMGAETIRPLLHSLIPHVEFITRPRLSQLSYTGFRKLTRLPKRSAIVAFSMDDVYATAELVRRHRGGTAVVLGALSPRTRNKQVEMYQSGEVDFLVATDAIGMGLNMDIDHVALASLRKFDGQAVRPLDTAEVAQVAGRAGRYLRDGTFGVTGRLSYLDDETVAAVEQHAFPTLKTLYWRNSALDFQSPRALLGSLDRSSGQAALLKGRPADDYRTLTALMARDDVMGRAESRMAVSLLWDVCQIPDFRQTLNENHQALVAEAYISLMDQGVIASEVIDAQLSRLDKIEGDVDSLMARIAHVRTWTYITHKSEWLRDAPEWQEKARAIEDRLSDALHDGLIRQFVDRRSSVLLRAREDGSALLAGVKADGTVVVEGHEVGRLHGFRFVPDEDGHSPDYKAVMTAARTVLKPEIKRRLGLMLNADAKQFTLNDEGYILYQSILNNPLPGEPVARLRKGQALLQPDVEIIESHLLEGQDKAAVADKLKGWAKAHIETVLESLVPLQGQEGLEGSARGIAYQLYEALGIVPRADIEELIAGLDEAGRAALRARKVRLGPVLVFLPALNKPAAVRLRALLWALWNGLDLPVQIPADGVTSVSIDGKAIDASFYRAIGYPVYGPRAIRVDMLDRLISAVYDSAKDGKFQAQHKMAEWIGSSIPDLYAVLEAMGHKKLEEQPQEAASSAAPAATSDGATSEVVASEGVASEVAAAESAAPDAAKPASVPVTADASSDSAPTADATPAVDPATTPAAPAAKPVLATFQLRRGKAYGAARRPHTPYKGKPQDKAGGKPAHTPSAHNKSGPSQSGPSKHASTKENGDKAAFKSRKRPPARNNDRGAERPERVISARSETRLEDSPFAVLQGLKIKGKD